MKSRLDLTLRKSERVLERVLSLMGRRGFDVASLEAHPATDGASLQVEITVVSDRPAAILARQLTKLHDVIEVIEVKTNGAA